MTLRLNDAARRECRVTNNRVSRGRLVSFVLSSVDGRAPAFPLFRTSVVHLLFPGFAPHQREGSAGGGAGGRGVE